MKAKKFLSLVAALVLAMSLAGCGKPSSGTPADPANTGSGTPAEPANGLGDFPSKDVRLLIPYAAGGNSDLNARKLAEIVDKYNLLNGHQLIVTNIQGSATQECFNALMTADPDGYTICLQHNAILTQPAFGNVTFTMEDVEAVCEVMEQPFMIFADADAPYNNTAELVQWCRDNPGEQITMGVPGVGASGQIGIEVYLNQTGIRDSMQFVYYGSGGDSLTGHLSGECILHGGFASDGIRYVESGDLKVLAVSGQERNPAIPDVECFGELGFDLDYMTYQGMWATKGTPAAVLEYLAGVFRQAIETEEYEAYCAEQGAYAAYAGPQEWHDLMADLDVTVRKLVDDLGLAS